MEQLINDPLSDFRGTLTSFHTKWSAVHLRRCRLLAAEWIDERGKLRFSPEEVYYPIGDEDELEYPLRDHLKQVVKWLDVKEVRDALEKIQEPYDLPLMERMVRWTLMLKENEQVTAAIARRAVLCSMLHYLRQNVGSCFATAPAIKIQQEEPLQFLRDMQQLLTLGRLERVVAGVEYIAPASSSFGSGDLFRPQLIDGELVCAADRVKDREKFLLEGECALLKCWEFTLASLSEAKAEFTKWNLYSSLGLDYREAGGIGELLYVSISEKMGRYQEQAKELDAEYQALFYQLKGLERRVQSGGDSWAIAEFKAKREEFFSIEERRNRFSELARAISELYQQIIDKFNALFPVHFQELYDPEMVGLEVSLFDDRPAGFRLYHKAGRIRSAKWEPIRSPEGFIAALRSFFGLVELEFKGVDALDRDLTEIFTELIQFIQSDLFLISALNRMSVAHGGARYRNPLEHLDKLPKKPWAYTSGGQMKTLLKVYYRLEQDIEEKERWVESPHELFSFILDILKRIPTRRKSYLMHSPTHAFLLKLGDEKLQEGIENQQSSFTWIRDAIIKPQKAFFEGIQLSEDESLYLIKRMSEFVPHGNRAHFLSQFRKVFAGMRPNELRAHVLKNQDILSAEWIDHLLYHLLPLFPVRELRERLDLLVPGIQIELPTAEMGTADLLLTLAKRGMGRLYDPEPLTRDLIRKAEDLGFTAPTPVIFADTNWPGELFAFLVSPGTLELEFWRVNPLGRSGYPMSQWHHWLDGSRKEPKWGIYS